MTKISTCPPNDATELCWDKIAESRYHQISTGLDITYNQFLIPHLKKLARPAKRALDIGCGIGFLTNSIVDICESILGIDPSASSIKIGKEKFPNLNFIVSCLEDFSHQSTFDLIISNMVIHNVPDLYQFLSSIKRLSEKDTSIIFSMCHPSYWPKYKNLDKLNDFSYNEEREFKIPFTISNDTTALCEASYFHRPLDIYLQAFKSAGLVVESLLEPMPEPALMALYPKPWDYPRYMFVKLALV